MNLSSVDIIGGGLGGLAAALSLEKEGIDFHLFEKNHEISYKKVGLGISSNIFPILESWNLFSQSKEIGAEIKRLVFTNHQLRTIKVFPIASSPWSVDRQQFHQLLHGQIRPENVNLGAKRSIQDLEQGRVSIISEGIHSSIRDTVFPGIKIRKSGQIIFRGICQMEALPQMKNSYFDLIGNGLRFAFIDTGINKVSWYAIVPESCVIGEAMAKEQLLRLFSGYHSLVIQAIKNTESVYVEELVDIDPKSRRNTPWFHKNMVFIGDAIHATTPNLANGACLAMEDAYKLVNSLKHNFGEPELAFRSFQKDRSRKVNSIVNLSWWLGKSLHWNSKWADPIMSQSLKYSPKWLFDAIYSNVLK